MEENKTTPTATQIEVLMSDWLGNIRESGTYIHKDTRGAINRKIKKGGNYSDYFLGNTTDMEEDDILRRAREIAQGVVNGMTAEPTKVTLGSTGSFTDGRTITVASDYFDNPELSIGEKIDILTGYAVHEACHVNHSDFDRINELKKHPSETARLKKRLMNILEDERIEYLLGESTKNGGDGMPGLTDFLGCAKKHTFTRYDKEIDRQNINLDDRVPSFLNCLLKAVRYPAALTEEEIVHNFNELDKVRKILTPYPLSQAGVESAADEIIDVMKDMMTNKPENKKEDEQKEKSENTQDNNRNNGSESKEQESSQDEKKGQNSPGNSESGGNEQSESDENSNETTGQEAGQALEQALQDSNTQKLLNEIDEVDNASSSGNSNCLSLKDNREFVNGDSEKVKGAGGYNQINYIKRTQGDKREYEKGLKIVKKWVPAMSKALRCKTEDHDYELIGMKSGKLNTSKLVYLMTENPNIFTKRGTITTDSACICILIDESLSMKGNRMTGARNAAILINEAVRHIPNLELFVYGFTDNELNVYCERNYADRHALGCTKASGGTPTAEAMKVASERIRKMTASKCLMLIITDGQPDDKVATQKQDKLLKRKGFMPVGVDIDGSEHVRNVFEESISTTDMNRLALKLGKIVRTKLSKSLRNHNEN